MLLMTSRMLWSLRILASTVASTVQCDSSMTTAKQRACINSFKFDPENIIVVNISFLKIVRNNRKWP